MMHGLANVKVAGTETETTDQQSNWQLLCSLSVDSLIGVSFTGSNLYHKLMHGNNFIVKRNGGGNQFLNSFAF